MKIARKLLLIGGLLTSLGSQTTLASEEDELEAMQRQLNAEVLAKPFAAPDDDKVDAFIKDAMEKDLKPPEYTGKNWRSGYTCNDMLRYSWREYRDCRYYRRYHGRYYW